MKKTLIVCALGLFLISQVGCTSSTSSGPAKETKETKTTK
jgi:hypothetical protein